MTSDEIKDVLMACLEAPPDRRDALLDTRCAGDPEGASRVRSLLAAHERAEGRLVPATVAADEIEAQWIAGRRIVRVLGEGGFGLVYLASESEPIERHVAVKVIRPGHGTGDIIARFESERRVLALMNHPGIAHIFEAGTTEDGRPYVVMEYVDGLSITAYCRRNELSVRECVRLLERTCLAIHHAHQKGVIHRDVKPSNVLVSESDTGPTPKVIDFGIAKAMEQTRGELTPVMTATRQIIGTPQYMAPEQAIVGGAGLDTRADVYALGVLMYECLAGVPPFDTDRLARASMGELERILREEDPPLASARVARSGTADDHAARARALRGELDWIIGRAMEKEPERRYPSAAAMATDLRRWLEGRAVDAGPVSGLYRTKKVIARHRMEFAFGLIILLLVAGALIVSMVYATRANEARLLAQEEEVAAKRELAKYEQITDFTQDMLSGIDPGVARGADTALLEKILADAEARLVRSPPEDGEVSGTLRLMMGLAYRSIGDYERAVPLVEQAAIDIDSVLDPLSERSMEAHNALGVLYAETDQLDRALPTLERIHTSRAAVFGENDNRTLEALANYGAVLRRVGRHDEASAVMKVVYEQRRDKHGDDAAETAAALNNYAMSLAEFGRLEEAREMLERVARVQESVLGSDSPRLLATRNNLAGILHELAQFDGAIAEYRSVLATKRRVLPRLHPSLLTTMSNMGNTMRQAGHDDDAVAILEEALVLAREGLPGRDMRTATIALNLAISLQRVGRLDEALPLMEESAATTVALLGEEHRHSYMARLRLASIEAESGAHEDAVRTLDALLPGAREACTGNAPALLTILDCAADVCRFAGMTERAVGLLEERYQGAVAYQSASSRGARATARRLAELSGMLGRAQEAERWSSLSGFESQSER